MLLIGVIDNLIPSAENPHEIHAESEIRSLHDLSGVSSACTTSGDHPERGLHDHSAHGKKLMRMGLFTALAITIHNFPEGLATFLAALQDPGLGVAIAVAIAPPRI